MFDCMCVSPLYMLMIPLKFFFFFLSTKPKVKNISNTFHTFHLQVHTQEKRKTPFELPESKKINTLPTINKLTIANSLPSVALAYR